MLINYGFKNFFSFREESFISFELDKNVPTNISNGRKYSTLVGIKGANSSGKTNIIKALSFLKEFITSSSKKEHYKIPVSSFMGNKENTYIYAEFIINDIQYKYEVEINSKKVISEKISRKIKKWTPILLRNKLDVTHTIKELESIKDIIVNDNTSVISTLSNFKFFDELEDLSNVYKFFEKFGLNVDVSTGMNSLTDEFNAISEHYNNNPAIFEVVKLFLMKSDMGIADIEILEDKNSRGETYYVPVFKHVYEDKTVNLFYRDQSSGTRHLFMALALYFACLRLGSVLALDEFDIHLHALLLPMILDLFESPETNPHGAQFVFTSHNTEIIDKLGKYRTVLVNKEGSESYCYRLDEIDGPILRNDRPISPIYSKGLIGGVPIL
ncbi:ATP-binding protein [Pseudomonas viridiflava]|uniref:AAA family ATPase n=1 Tax=Pseudomonas viridiflava TaxID=33069 RepID=UPI002EC921C8|nr:ATP-binding protein [Pseudomonas viridiflava]